MNIKEYCMRCRHLTEPAIREPCRSCMETGLRWERPIGFSDRHEERQTNEAWLRSADRAELAIFLESLNTDFSAPWVLEFAEENCQECEKGCTRTADGMLHGLPDCESEKGCPKEDAIIWWLKQPRKKEERK